MNMLYDFMVISSHNSCEKLFVITSQTANKYHMIQSSKECTISRYRKIHSSLLLCILQRKSLSVCVEKPNAFFMNLR